MKKEPFLLKNAFALLGFGSWLLSLYIGEKNEKLSLLLLGIAGFCLIMQIYYWTKIDLEKELQRIRDSYQKAHYFQARRRSFRIIKGGKNESLGTGKSGNRSKYFTGKRP